MTKSHRSITQYETLLRDHGLRVTRGRITLLTVLARQVVPQSITAIRTLMRPCPDKVTLYRSLEILERAGIIRRVDLRHAHAHYELMSGREHHHHLVCTHCGEVEDVEVCTGTNIERNVLNRSSRFASVQDHALELFGTCKMCAK